MISIRSLAAYDFYTSPYLLYNAPAYMYIIAILFETLLYGIYLALFFVCVHILLRNKRTVQSPLLVLAILMFTLATADIGVTYAYLLRHLLRGEITPFKYIYPKLMLYTTNSALGDTLVIYRCYVVWGHDKRIIIFPCALLLSATICGYLLPSLGQSFPVYLWMSLALNSLVTILTAGRIWWISRKARRILGDDLVKRYNSAIAVIVESGAIYSCYVILVVVLPVGQVVADFGLIQVVGIVPALIMVQVGLSRDTSDIATTISAMQHEPRESSSSAGRDGRVSRPTSVLDIRLAQVSHPERGAPRWNTNGSTAENVRRNDTRI